MSGKSRQRNRKRRHEAEQEFAQKVMEVLEFPEQRKSGTMCRARGGCKPIETGSAWESFGFPGEETSGWRLKSYFICR
jgi:hypothetical protein